jgi:hypothetical protein
MHFCWLLANQEAASVTAFQATLGESADAPSFWQNQIEFMNENRSTRKYLAVHADSVSFSLHDDEPAG